MKLLNHICWLVLSVMLFWSCEKNNNKERPLKTDYSHRPKIVICPLNAYSSLSFRVLTSRNGRGEIVQQIEWIEWQVADPKIGFKNTSVQQLESKIEDAFSLSGMIMFEEEHYYCCYAGVSGPLKIYADVDIAGHPAGEDISDLFVVSPGYEMLVSVKYPEMEPVHYFGYIENHRIYSKFRVPINEYFAEGSSPLMSVSGGCVLGVIDGYESLMDEILSGTKALHFELPVTGINSDGEEEFRVLTGTIDNA